MTAGQENRLDLVVWKGGEYCYIRDTLTMNNRGLDCDEEFFGFLSYPCI